MTTLIRLESQLSRSHTQSLLKRRTSSLLVHHGHVDLLFAAIRVLHEFFICHYILHLFVETHHTFIEIASFIHLSSRFSHKRRFGDIELIVEVLVKQDLSSQWLVCIFITNWLWDKLLFDKLFVDVLGQILKVPQNALEVQALEIIVIQRSSESWHLYDCL
jgi:hypothetical protein